MRTVILAIAIATLFVAATSNATHLPPASANAAGGAMLCEPDQGQAANPQVAVASDWGSLTLTAVGLHLHPILPFQHPPPPHPCTFEVRFTGAFALVNNPAGNPANVGGGIANWNSVPCTVWAPVGGACVTTATAWWAVNFPDTAGIDIAYELFVNGNVVAAGQARVVDPSVPGGIA